MKKTLLFGLVLALGTALSVSAAEREGKSLTPEQKKERDAVIQKYDANKDGVLDKTELKSLSKADKKTLAKTGGVATAKGDAKAATKEERVKAEKEVKGKKEAEASETEAKVKPRKGKK